MQVLATCVASSNVNPTQCSIGYYYNYDTCSSCASVTCAAGFYMAGCQLGLTPPQCAVCPPNLLLEPTMSIPTGSRMWISISQLMRVTPFAHPPGKNLVF